MIRSNLILDLNAELFVDNFAGGGGASTGIEMALGRHVDHAINHDRHALGMHRINHPQTVHHCEDVFDVDPAAVTGGRPVGGGWFSPDCKHFSKAKGGKPLSKKIRGLAFVILRWAKIRTRVIYMENVEEIQTWGPLNADGKPDKANLGRTWLAFLAALGSGVDQEHPDLPEMLEVLGGTVTREELTRGFGYTIETRELRGCDYGAPTIRKRLFMIARCDGMPIVWPDPTHFAPDELAAARKRYGRGVQPWKTAADCIDWSIPCNSIFLTGAEAKAARCKRPLAKASLRRIATGIDRFVMKAKRPFMVSLTHQGGERIEDVASPMMTITGANRGEKALVTTFVTECANASSQRTMPADEPLRTQCAEVKGGHFALCAANMVKMRGTNVGDAASAPVHTVSAAGQHHGLALAYMVQNNGGYNETPGHSISKPVSTITAAGSQQSLITANIGTYYGNAADIGQGVDTPLRTATTKERFCLAQSELASVAMTPEQIAGARRVAAFLRSFGVKFDGEFATVDGLVIFDIGMRMLTARELFRAQGFAEAYEIERAWLVDPKTGEVTEERLTKTQQIRMCGNSVCPPIAAALVAANSADMAVWRRSERKQPFNLVAA